MDFFCTACSHSFEDFTITVWQKEVQCPHCKAALTLSPVRTAGDTCRCGKRVVEHICLRCFKSHSGHEGGDPTCFDCAVDLEIRAMVEDVNRALHGHFEEQP